MDVSKEWVGPLNVLLVLPLIVLQLVGYLFLEDGQIVRLQTSIVIILLDNLQDLQKCAFAVEVICVGRVGDLVPLTINVDKIFLNTLEDHCAEHGLIEGYRRGTATD